MNDLDLEVEKRSRADHDLLDIINAVERVLVLVAIILTVGIVVLFNQASKQADEIKGLQEQVRANRESILHQAEVGKRQEVILNKLNADYQMKHYQKEVKNESEQEKETGN